MARYTPEELKLERLSEGRIHVSDDPRARVAKALLEAHFLAEWNDDIEGTMATMDPDAPFQRIPALGLEVTGVDAVRAYYLERFASWPGPAMPRFDRVTVAPDVILVEGQLVVAKEAPVSALSGPAVIVIDIREGRILGETVYGSVMRA